MMKQCNYTHTLPCELYSTESVRQGEKVVASHLNIELSTLMERAGQSVFDYLMDTYPSLNHILICCGKGSNGGDGYITAALALQANISVTLWQVGSTELLSGDALHAKNHFLNLGGSITSPTNIVPDSINVVVDAILGTGLSGPARAYHSHVIDRINQSNLPVVSIDVPSGIDADTGHVFGKAIIASHTVTFIGVKSGLVTGNARQYVGQLVFAGLGIQDEFRRVITPLAQLSNNQWMSQIRSRKRDAHKGNQGKVVVIGGDSGMSGAAYLASAAAFRVGAGLVTTVSHTDSLTPLRSLLPEAMIVEWGHRHLSWGTVACVGVGLGRNQWGEKRFSEAELYFDTHNIARVLDADALYWLARKTSNLSSSIRILTPHPGEAASLLDVSVATIEENRYLAANQLVDRFGGIIVLKGAGTLVCDGNNTVVCHAGNPGMAIGGMGDVLAGVITGLLAQGYSPYQAAVLGTLVHSIAADQCAEERGEVGMLASDLLPYLREVANSYNR
ncbi:NAD(P)H-hydrate dehydratase [Vibrio sp. E150_011]